MGKGGKYADAAYGQGSQYRLKVFAKGAFLLKLHFFVKYVFGPI